MAYLHTFRPDAHQVYSHSFWPDAGQYEHGSESDEVYHTREDCYYINGNNCAVGELLPFPTLRKAEVVLNVETITTLHSGSCTAGSITTTSVACCVCVCV